MPPDEENSIAIVAPPSCMHNYKILIDQSPKPETDDLPTPLVSRSNSPLSDPILASHNKLVAVASRDGSDILNPSVGEEEGPSPPVSELVTAAPTPYPTSVIPPDPGQEFICHVCRRRLASAEMLKKHEELSALHEKNLKLLKIANQKKRNDLRSDVVRLRHVVDMPDGAELRPELNSSEQELGRTQEEIEQRAGTLLSQSTSAVLGDYTLDFSGSSWTGNKQTNEDRMMVGFELIGGKVKGCLIADGHCGDHCADYLVSNLLVNIEDAIEKSTDLVEGIRVGFAKTDSEYIQQAIVNQIPAGSTVIILLFFQQGEDLKGIVAHVGDSRGLVRDSSSGNVVRLTADHKPDRPDELERLNAAGGHVVDVGGVWRVFTPTVVSVGGRSLQWGLAVSRAFGDLALKHPKEIVSAVPEIFEIEKIDPKSIFVIACDGIFDVLTDDETIDAAIHDGPSGVLRTAYGKLSDDNLTAIVVNVSKIAHKRHLEVPDSEEPAPDGKKIRLSYLPSEIPTEPLMSEVSHPPSKILTSSQFI